jgi:hypothetical protein
MRNGIDHEETRLRIEQWRDEASRMWAIAHESIQRVKQVQDQLVQQSQSQGNTHRVGPWVEE